MNIDIDFDFATFIKNYFDTISESISQLSNMNERHLKHIPFWCLNQDIVILLYFEANRIDIYINPYTGRNCAQLISIKNVQEFSEIIEKMNVWLKIGHENMFTPHLNIESYPTDNSISMAFAGFKFSSSGNEFGGLEMLSHDYHFMGSPDDLFEKLSVEQAKNEAVKIWNDTIIGDTVSSSNDYIMNVKNTIHVLEKLIHRKEYLERKIHRYINKYAHIILPHHNRCYFETDLYSNDGEKQVADFILERDTGMAPLLIELESPWLKIFKANGELTAEANHAKNQIGNWVRFIDTNSKNFENGFDFLQGNKDRLVIGGRGLNNIKQMLNSKHENTTIWTYTLLIHEAKKRWNRHFEEQFTTIKLKKALPFTDNEVNV